MKDVVAALQSLLDKSKEASTRRKETYQDQMCVWDKQKANHTKLLEDNTKKKEKNEVKKALNLANAGEASQQLGDADAEITRLTEQAALEKEMRDNESAAWEKRDADATGFIAQLDEALEILQKVGAKQEDAAEDTKQFLAAKPKAELASVRTILHKVLLASNANGGLTERKVNLLGSFLQQKGPSFSDTYSSSSGEIYGILEDMKDSMTATQKAEKEEEKKAQEAFLESKAAIEGEIKANEEIEETARKNMEEANADLADALDAITEAKAAIELSSEFLEVHTPIFAQKEVDYAKSVKDLQGEQAALAQAIAILDSDDAFAAVAAANEIGFLQLRSVRAHGVRASEISSSVQQVLLKAHSEKLTLIARALAAGSAFDVVLDAMNKTIENIEEEALNDFEQKNRLEEEYEKQTKMVSDMDASIEELDKKIADAEAEIQTQEDNINAEKESIKTAQENMDDATELRTQEHLQNAKDVQEAHGAKLIMKQAAGVLHAFYSKQEDNKMAEDVDIRSDGRKTSVEELDDKHYKSESGVHHEEGTAIFQMLEDLVAKFEGTIGERLEVEATAQEGYEEQMLIDKTTKTESLKALAEAKLQKAKEEKKLSSYQKDKATDEKKKKVAEGILANIDEALTFLRDNYEKRNQTRKDQITAIEEGIATIKGTDYYKNSVWASKLEEMTKKGCKKECSEYDEVKKETTYRADNKVPCHACMKGITVKGFCTAVASGQFDEDPDKPDYVTECGAMK